MARGEVALNEETVVLGVIDGLLVVLAGERLDGVDRLPQREHHELGQLADVAPQHPRAAVARRRDVAREPGLPYVPRVGVAVLAPHGALPDARDHAPQDDAPARAPCARMGS